MKLELDKYEMEVVLSTILMNQVVKPAHESVIYDLCQTWQQPPVIVKEKTRDIMNRLVVTLVEELKDETEYEQERLEDNQVNVESVG